jgi:hypothetical protein
MNRRRFLSSTALAGAAIVGLAPSAPAFTLEKCEGDGAGPACREVARHDELLAELRKALENQGASRAAREAALRAASCPVCGQLLGG